MSILNNILNSFGLCLKDKEELLPYNYDPESYTHTTDLDILKSHVAFLENSMKGESDRMNTIENKTYQIISQTGIIFSLVGLIIPILIDKFNHLGFLLEITIFILLISAFIFYTLAINNALKNLKVNKFKYANASPETVIRFQNNDLNTFYSDLIQSLLFSINKNTAVNNKKASNLIHAHNSFKLANILTALLITIFSTTLLFSSSKPSPTKVKGEIEIIHLDSNIRLLINTLDKELDTPIYNKALVSPSSKQK